MAALLVVMAALVALANGANDNGKGVATLVGLGDASPRKALAWATFTTLIGSVISYWAGAGLVEKFSGAVISSSTPLGSTFFVAVLAGTGGWVLLATRFGLPVSTTHAIVGSFVGAGLASTMTVKWPVLVAKFAIPLALSPLLSCVVVLVLARAVGLLVRRTEPSCICVTAMATADGMGSVPMVVTGHVSSCPKGGAQITTTGAARAGHWAAAGLIGFARGWNDTPKLAALSMGGVALLFGRKLPEFSFGLTAVAIAAGGLLVGTRVLRTMSHGLTTMQSTEATVASATTAALVSIASWGGLPVSTTHVSTGSIVGSGLGARLNGGKATVQWKKVGEIGLSWIVTLPAAALMASVFAFLLSRLGA